MSLYLTTIITVAGTVLLLRQTAAILAADSDLTITALPAVYRLLLLCLQLINFYYFRLQPTDFYCFHLQPNWYLTAFLQYYKYKKELLEASYRA